MLIHPQFNPIALDLTRFGIPVQIHWYGITYLVAFGLFLWLARLRVRKPWFADAGWTARDVEDLLFFGVLGVVLGGRLGYVLFYKPGFYLANPLEIFSVWKGGMSFHGGLLGVTAAMALFAWLRKRSFWDVMDLIAPCVPTGLLRGRIGNFSLPWGMVFPQSGSPLPRHPSQLYEFGMEGLLLFGLLWWYGSKPRWAGQLSGAFLMGYGFFRFVAEYFREPDAFLGLLALNMSMGQWLCVPMIVGGALVWAWATRRARPIGAMGAGA